MSILKDVLHKVGLAEDHPPLPADHPASQRVETAREPLRQLAGQVRDRLELVPGEDAHYVFIGKPPKAFGVAWIHDGEWSNFKTLSDEHGVSAVRLQTLVESLQAAYERSASTERFMIEVGGRDVVVMPSDTLAREVREVIDAVLAEHARS